MVKSKKPFMRRFTNSETGKDTWCCSPCAEYFLLNSVFPSIFCEDCHEIRKIKNRNELLDSMKAIKKTYGKA